MCCYNTKGCCGSITHSTLCIIFPVLVAAYVYIGTYGRVVDPSSALYQAQLNITSLKRVLEFSLVQDGTDVR